MYLVKISDKVRVIQKDNLLPYKVYLLTLLNNIIRPYVVDSSLDAPKKDLYCTYIELNKTFHYFTPQLSDLFRFPAILIDFSFRPDSKRHIISDLLLDLLLDLNLHLK